MQPPYPADTRAKGWRLEIDHERIRQSDTWALASPELRPWLLMLWMVAWEQTPCGSLPADDALIAARIGMSPKVFAKNREVLMRGWIEADDGRLYHKVLSERVTEMLARRLKDRARTAKLRAASSDGVTRDTPATHNGVQRESHVSSTPEPDTSNQRKEKEPPKPPAADASVSGKPDDARKLLAYLNAKTGKHFRCVPASLDPIRARLKDATPEQVRAVIDDRVKAWASDEAMAKYLRPETLFRASKFEGYLGNLGASKPAGRPGQIAGAVVDWSATEDA